MIVGNRVRVPLDPVSQCQLISLKVDLFDFAGKELHLFQKFSERIYDSRQL